MGFISWLFGRRPASSRRHKRNIARAENLLKQFRGWRGNDLDARIIAYLKKIDPYVFEELTLSALRDAGVNIQRNHSYSGDGGIDGRFCVPDRPRRRGKERRRLKCGVWAVQCKRYQGQISTQHVIEFARLVSRQGYAGGVFAHTGRTPPGARAAFKRAPGVVVVSGSRLVDLVLGRRELQELCG